MYGRLFAPRVLKCLPLLVACRGCNSTRRVCVCVFFLSIMMDRKNCLRKGTALSWKDEILRRPNI